MFDEFAEGGDDLGGDGAGFAVTDEAAVELDGGDDLGGGAGEEAFVGGEEVVASHHLLFAGEAELAEDFDDGLAGDAVETASGDGRGVDFAVFGDEDVVAGAFGDVALFVEHDALFATGLDGLNFGHDVVEVVEGFDLGAEGSGGGATGGAGDEVEAFFVAFRGVQRDGAGDDDDAGAGALEGVQAEGADAAGNDEADVSVLEVVSGNGFEGGLFHFLDWDGNLHANGAGGLIEALYVGGETEDATVIDANAFEDAVSIEQAVIEHGDFGVFFVEQLAVDVDFHSEGAGERQPFERDAGNQAAIMHGAGREASGFNHSLACPRGE